MVPSEAMGLTLKFSYYGAKQSNGASTEPCRIKLLKFSYYGAKQNNGLALNLVEWNYSSRQ